MKQHSLFNMVLVFPDDMRTASEPWTNKASKAEILDTFKGWDPVVIKPVEKLSDDDKVMKWKLCVYDPLSTCSKGKVCLLGDDCHPDSLPSSRSDDSHQVSAQLLFASLRPAL